MDLYLENLLQDCTERSQNNESTGSLHFDFDGILSNVLSFLISTQTFRLSMDESLYRVVIVRLN